MYQIIFLKTRRNEVLVEIKKIHAFTEVYSINVNIYELESTFDSIHKFINPEASNISFLCIEKMIIIIHWF